MWSLTNRLARPPLAQHLAATAERLNAQAQSALGEGEAGREDLQASIAAAAVCWRLWRPVLSRRRWQGVKRSLEVQRRALADGRTRQQRRRFRRALQHQSNWLGEVAAAPLPADEVVVEALVRLYRKARRAARADPTAGRARRHLARLVLAEELLFPRAGPNRVGDGPGPAARRMLLAAMTERSRRPGRRRRFRRRLKRGLVGMVPAALGLRPRHYRREMMWLAFLALAPAPAAAVPGAREGAQAPDMEAGLPRT